MLHQIPLPFIGGDVVCPIGHCVLMKYLRVFKMSRNNHHDAFLVLCIFFGFCGTSKSLIRQICRFQAKSIIEHEGCKSESNKISQDFQPCLLGIQNCPKYPTDKRSRIRNMIRKIRIVKP